ncbi:MAG TPA: hypothetical protein VGN13_12370 [Solirubrobacteraceae bacterium]
MIAIAIHDTNAATHAATKAERATKALRAYQIASCYRGNERTQAENGARLDDYRFDTTTAHLVKLALTIPHAPNPQESVQQEREGLALTKGYVHNLEVFAEHKAWHPLTPNCEYAVDHPRTYHFPKAVPFARREPPPAALSKLARSIPPAR